MQSVVIKEMERGGWSIHFARPVNAVFTAPTAVEARALVSEWAARAAQRAENEGFAGVMLLDLAWEPSTRVGRMVAKALAGGES